MFLFKTCFIVSQTFVTFSSVFLTILKKREAYIQILKPTNTLERIVSLTEFTTFNAHGIFETYNMTFKLVPSFLLLRYQNYEIVAYSTIFV